MTILAQRAILIEGKPLKGSLKPRSIMKKILQINYPQDERVCLPLVWAFEKKNTAREVKSKIMTCSKLDKHMNKNLLPSSNK